MTNNQPQVWISGHKLLVFWESRYNLHNCLLNVCFLYIMSFYLYFIYTLYLMFNYFHCFIMLIVTINCLLTYLLIYFLLTYRTHVRTSRVDCSVVVAVGCWSWIWLNSTNDEKQSNSHNTRRTTTSWNVESTNYR